MEFVPDTGDTAWVLMGTALVLLFLLALGAIPGALLPQRSLNAGKVDDYLKAHPVLGPWLDRAQAFNVFSSFWFTAIYVLLFVSLVGCLTPRMIEHVRSLRSTPVAAPRTPPVVVKEEDDDDPEFRAAVAVSIEVNDLEELAKWPHLAEVLCSVALEEAARGAR